MFNSWSSAAFTIAYVARFLNPRWVLVLRNHCFWKREQDMETKPLEKLHWLFLEMEGRFYSIP